MKYTVRYAHLETLPRHEVGSALLEGMVVGKMGDSGQSSAPHLHFDVIESHVPTLYRLSQVGYSRKHKYTPSIVETNYFMDKNLFEFPYVITTFYGDPRYKEKYNKDHYGYDCVPTDRHTSDKHFDIHWNRSYTGYVLSKGYDENGYGNYIQIGYTK